MSIFNTDSSCLHYYEYGSGKKVLLAFHGFGMKGTQFEVLESAFAKEYKIISFDLFFHGDTLLNDNSVKSVRKGLQSKDFANQIEQFLDEKFPGVDKVSILAYSIGTRMALCLIENIPQRLANAFLIAPDGIEPNKLLKLGGANFVVNRIFHKLVYSPKTVKFIMRQLLKFNYIDDAIFRILSGEFATTENRLNSYNTITYYSKLSFNQQKIANNINQYQLNCHFYFGKRDTLFPSSIGDRFGKLLNRANIHVFDDGHELVNLAMNKYITAQLQADDN